MSLTDLMSGMNLVHWPLAALLIFVSVFVGVVIWTLTRPRSEIERAARLPIQDDDAVDGARRRSEP